MKANPSIFKSYDVRGIYPEELNEESAFNIGRAFVEYTGCKNIVVGHDARLSCEALFLNLTNGIKASGSNVVDIGQVPTECVYFAVGAKEYDGGVMITASHNPKEYNGFKMIKKTGEGIDMIRGIDLLPIVEQEKFNNPDGIGKLEKKDIIEDFTKYVLNFAGSEVIKDFKVVVDASNGVAGLVIPQIAEKIPANISILNFEPDGNFLAHGPNPLIDNATDQIAKEVIKEKADFGMIFDGDADRIFLIDEEGKMVNGDATLLLLAKYFLEKNPGMAVAYNLICSKATSVFIKKYGGVPIKTKVGFVNVKEGLTKNNGILGGEMSGHYCFKDNYYMDSGMIAFIKLLIILSKDQRKLSEIIKELTPYSKGDANFTVKDKAKILEDIKNKYSDGKQDFMDGITVEYNDWWFNVRPSNNEPLIRLTIEADTKEILDQKQKELTDFIENN